VRLAGLALVLLVGCQLADVEDVQLRDFDYADFVDQVQPVLDELCANPSCHARAERALSIYSTRAWRANVDETYLPTELSDAELRHNYQACIVMTAEAAQPHEARLLRKSLGQQAFTYHGGGEIFADTSDRDFRVLHNWVSGGWPR
jgi:hypothetical protein